MAWENFHGRTLGGKRGSNYQKALPNLSKGLYFREGATQPREIGFGDALIDRRKKPLKINISNFEIGLIGILDCPLKIKFPYFVNYFTQRAQSKNVY